MKGILFLWPEYFPLLGEGTMFTRATFILVADHRNLVGKGGSNGPVSVTVNLVDTPIDFFVFLPISRSDHFCTV